MEDNCVTTTTTTIQFNSIQFNSIQFNSVGEKQWGAMSFLTSLHGKSTAKLWAAGAGIIVVGYATKLATWEPVSYTHLTLPTTPYV